MRKLLRKYYDICQRPEITESEINTMRRLFNGVARSSLTKEEKDAVYNAFEKSLPKYITKEQTQKGINFLRNMAFKKNGQPRETKEFPFGYRELEIIKDFNRFKLHTLRDVSSGAYSWPHFMPVYSVHSCSGDKFFYVAGYHAGGKSFGGIEVL